MYSRLYRFYFYWPTLLLVGLVLSCQKTEVKDDPCAGLMSEGPLKQIGVIFIDKETGEYLVETTEKEASGINVTEAHTGGPFKNWNIYYHPENPIALNGVVILHKFFPAVRVNYDALVICGTPFVADRDGNTPVITAFNQART